MPRVTLNIPQAMLDDIDAKAEELFSSRSVAVRYLYGRKWSQSTSPCIKVNQPDITVHQSAHPSPDPARAREQSTKVVVGIKDTTTGQNGRNDMHRIAALFIELDWREAELPQSLTPLMYAAQLVEMFPERDLIQDIQRAQIWHLDRKPSWKRLAHSLNGWLAKPKPEWEKRGQQSMFGTQKQSEQQDYSKGAEKYGFE